MTYCGGAVGAAVAKAVDVTETDGRTDGKTRTPQTPRLPRVYRCSTLAKIDTLEAIMLCYGLWLAKIKLDIIQQTLRASCAHQIGTDSIEN